MGKVIYEGGQYKKVGDAKQVIDTEISKLIGSAPEVLDTLLEISSAINNDPNFYLSVINVSNLLDNKLDASIYNTEKVNFASANDVSFIKNLGHFDYVSSVNQELDNVDNFINYKILTFDVNHANGNGGGIVFNVRLNASRSGVLYKYWDDAYLGRRVSWDSNNNMSASNWEYPTAILLLNRTADSFRLYIRDVIRLYNYGYVTVTSASSGICGLLTAADKAKLDSLKSNVLSGNINTKLNEMVSTVENVSEYSGRWMIGTSEVVQFALYEGNAIQHVSGNIGATNAGGEQLIQGTTYKEMVRTITNCVPGPWYPAEKGGFLQIGSDNAILNIRTLSGLQASADANSAMTDLTTSILITKEILDLCIEKGYSIMENGGSRIEISKTLNSTNEQCYSLISILQRYNNSTYPTIFSVCVYWNGDNWEIAKDPTTTILGGLIYKNNIASETQAGLIKIRILTQEEYNALDSKIEDCIYYITEP